MALIFQTVNFILETHEFPEIDRLDGGHIKISPKVSVLDRTMMNPRQAIEFVRLSIVAGKAMVAGMGKRGVEIGRINYQDNGNWKKEFHLHLYGRAVNATVQKFGEPIVPGHKDGFKPLDDGDIEAVRSEMEKLFALPEFKDEVWRL